MMILMKTRRLKLLPLWSREISGFSVAIVLCAGIQLKQRM